MARRLPRIWIITEPAHPDGPVAPLRRALKGCPEGMVGVQLRAKRSSDRQLVSWGRELRELTAQSGAFLTVNGRPDVAQIVEADGVHLGELGLLPEQVARVFPEFRLIGVSRHDRRGLEEAARHGASYAFLSPVLDVPGKGPPLGIHGFRDAIVGVGIPTFALGGLSDAHVPALHASGAEGVAIRRAIYDSTEPREALRAFVRALDKQPDQRA